MKGKRKKNKSFRRVLKRTAGFLMLCAALALVWYFPASKCKWKKDQAPLYADVRLLTLNSYSRPGTPLTSVNALVIHYVANPGTSALANRNYFEHLWIPGCNPAGTRASSHFIVGLKGEVIQCIPLYEIAYANYPRNGDTISIEVCHPDETGEFSSETYEALVRLASDLCAAYGLDSGDILRHYDVSGKSCPKFYVENEEAWQKLRQDVQALLCE